MERLKALIYKKFDNQSACATALGWHRQKLSRILLGHTVPTLADVQALAEVLDVEVGTIAEFFLPE